MNLMSSPEKLEFARLDGDVSDVFWGWIKENDIGRRFIKAIYGEDGALNSPSSLSKHSPWLDIIREVIVLWTKGINLLYLICKKVGNGLNTLFWKDRWLDDLALKYKFPILYASDNNKQITVVEKINHASMVDTFLRPPRVWSLEAICEFSVKSFRQLIDNLILLKEDVATRSFGQESSWEILHVSPKWDAPDPVSIPIPTVNVEGTSGGNIIGNTELFGEDKRPRPPGARAAKKTKSESSSGTGSQTSVFVETMSNELRLKRESQQDKDRTVIKFE
ncbi:hypothetical protein Tco_0383387 [Tanacetum coccineum]